MPTGLLNADDLRKQQLQRSKPDDVFGGLSGLVGVGELNAQRRAISNAQFQQDSEILDGQQLAAKTAGRLIGQAFARLGPDQQRNRAQAVDEAVAEARRQTGHEVPQAAAQEMKEQVRQESIAEAGEAATAATVGSGASNLFDQEDLLLSNTISELQNRGLGDEAASLIPKLQAVRNARTEEMQAQANLEGKNLDNEKSRQAIRDFRTGKTTAIVPRGAPGAVAAQVFHDGRANYWDPDEQKEVWLRPGEYVTGTLTGDKSSFDNKELVKGVEFSDAMIKTMGLMTRLRRSIAQHPDAATFTGDIGKIVNEFVPDFERFISENWFGRQDTLKENRGKMQNAFRRFGIVEQQQQVAIEKLAYALAASREGGKLSESDVLFAMNAFGGNSRDPAVRLSALDDIALDFERDWITFGGRVEGISSNSVYQRAGEFLKAYEHERVNSGAVVPRLGETAPVGGPGLAFPDSGPETRNAPSTTTQPSSPAAARAVPDAVQPPAAPQVPDASQPIEIDGDGLFNFHDGVSIF
jgi:hypothetical protein